VSSGREPLVLVVDDDEGVRTALETALRHEALRVRAVQDGVRALAAAEADPPALIVLDVTMPGIDGVEVTRTIRGRGDDVPILILSARDGVDDRVVGLEAGADDYLTKPFALEELLARIRALLRRRPEHASSVVREAGTIRVDPVRRQATISGMELDLTGREFELLEAFVINPGIVLSREQLLDMVWGYSFDVKTNVVDVFIGYLRRKLEAGGHPRVIHTVRGQGFALRV
jgi:two-component system, OmpR family, response regulator PrrA